MLALYSLLSLSFSQPDPDALSKPEEVISSHGRKILLNPDFTWSVLKDDKCDAIVRKGSTEEDGFSFSTTGDIFLSKGKAFTYILRSYPDKNEHMEIQLYRSKGTFQDLFDINFTDQNFYRGVNFETIKIPFRGWAFHIEKPLDSEFYHGLRTKRIKSFETHKHNYYDVMEHSSQDLRQRVQCMYDATHNYLNDPANLSKKIKPEPPEESEEAKEAKSEKEDSEKNEDKESSNQDGNGENASEAAPAGDQQPQN